ncbi:MAG: nucleotidyltransferase family protein [archaeon]|jgi:glucose-1-phosphate cytidylyltransferase
MAEKQIKKLKVVLLCGGKGTRLRPITESIPKPLVKLNGKSVLEYLMNSLAAQGLTSFVVCTGYKAEMVESEVNSFAKKDWKINFVNSGEEASILKRIIDASKFCGDNFIVCYGDAVADIDMNKVLKIHQKNNALVTNVLYRMESPFGLMETKDDFVVDYKEKPILPFWFNIGFFIFEQSALTLARDDNWIEFLKKLVLAKKMCALKHTGQHITFNTEPEKKEAEEKIKAFSYVFE